MVRDLTFPAVFMGLLAAFVGYSASFAIVLSGIYALGANPAQAATGLFLATLGMGLCSIWLPAVTRIPAAVAWSTPGAAFLASAAQLPGGFAGGVGALVVCGAMILATGLVPGLSRVVAAIPRPVASALLAGVLLKLCLAPALALGALPLQVLPILGAWLAGLLWHRLAAMPMAVVAFVAVLAITVEGGAELALALPGLAPVVPVFSWQAVVSVAVPLYLVTMAGQNIPGFAVLELNGYAVERQPMLRTTGAMSLAIAWFGAVPVNMSAITAAMMCGEDAGPRRESRYWAAIVSGLAYSALALAAGFIIAVAGLAPALLISTVAGLALIPALVAALSGSFADTARLEAPALTFLIAASGMTLFGVSGAFWGLLAGMTIVAVRRLRDRGAGGPA